jgi:WD40 repeat protein
VSFPDGQLLKLMTSPGVDAWYGPLSWSPDGRLLAAVAGSGELYLFNPEDGQVVTHTDFKLAGTRPRPPSVWSPDSRCLALAPATPDDIVVVWEWETGKVIRTLRGHTAPVAAVTYSPDSKTLATGGMDRTVRLWNARDGSLRATLLWVNGGQLVVVSPEGHVRYDGKEPDKAYHYKARYKDEDGVVRTGDFTPTEFADRFDWKNEPDKVDLRGR